MTQLFYRGEAYGKYLKDCGAAGITVPIIPGIMPIQNFRAFKAMTQYCKMPGARQAEGEIEEHKDNDEMVRDIGIDIVTKLCEGCIEHGAKGLHFYTLNLERSVREIIRRVGFAGVEGNASEPRSEDRKTKWVKAMTRCVPSLQQFRQRMGMTKTMGLAYRLATRT